MYTISKVSKNDVSHYPNPTARYLSLYSLLNLKERIYSKFFCTSPYVEQNYR